MNIHYDAFISYRHSPVDSKIAAEIQHRLEHFTVPRSIQKKTGKKKINRIFRDKEELPITSDLNDDIAEALANSDYLIVICSPRTGESVWVEREIETFLHTHTRHQVLTILAEGEPADTIPEILRYDETMDPVTGETRRVPVEPLSCDWRVPSRQARREELPRLAAALLGCAYDELRQRQRQYRLRRLTAVLSAALVVSLCLSVYFVRTSMMIRENYQQSLRNESRYLAAAALEQLEDGDRLTAILLALEALPDEKDHRPVVPQAEYALGMAVNAYLTESDSPVATGAFEPDGDPREFLTDEHGEQLCILDDMNLITLWDTETVQRTQTIDPGISVDGMLMAKDNRLVVWGDGVVLCYDRTTDELLWKMEQGFYGCEVQMNPDHTRLVVTGSTSTEDWTTVTYLYLVDLADGTVLEQYTVPSVPGFDEAPSVLQLNVSAFSPNGTKVLLAVLQDSRYYICRFDLEQGTGFYLEQSYDYLADFCFTPEGTILTAGAPEEGDSSYGMYNYFSYLVENNACVTGSDGETGQTIWSTDLSYYQISYDSELNLCSEGAEVLYTAANICQRMDCATGQVLGRCETSAPILDVTVKEDSSLLILRDGTQAVYYFDDNRCTGMTTLKNDLTQARQVYGPDNYSRIFVLPSYSSQVLLYRYGVVDDSWEAFEPDTAFGLVQQVSLTEDALAVLDSDDVLSLYDLENRTLSSQVELHNTDDYLEFQLLGFSDQDGRFRLLREEHYDIPAALLTVDPATGQVETVELPEGWNGISSQQTGGAVLWNELLIYTEYDWDQGAALAIYDPGADTVEYLPLWSELVRPTALSLGGDHLLAVGEDGRTVQVSLEDRKVTELEETLIADDYIHPQLAAWSADGSSLAGVGEEQVWIRSLDGIQTASIPLDNQQVLGLSFSPSGHELFLLCSDGYLYRWGVDGSFLSKTEIQSYNNASDSRTCRWTFTEEGDLALWTDDQVLNLISPDDWTVTAYATQCLGYLPQRQQLLCCRSGEESGTNKLCSYHRYSTQELVEKGRSIVGDTQLTEEVKSEYGLS